MTRKIVKRSFQTTQKFQAPYLCQGRYIIYFFTIKNTLLILYSLDLISEM